MSQTKEEKIILFNANGFKEDSSDKNIRTLPTELSAITQRSLDIKNTDISMLIQEMLDEAEHRKIKPILNIQFKNNNDTLLFSEEVLRKALQTFQDSSIKVCCTFQHYNAEEEEKKLNSFWKSLFAQLDHVFFSNADDRKVAITKKHIDQHKSTNIPSIDQSLKEAVKGLKGKMDARLLVTNIPLDKAEDITDLIMTKFNIGGNDENDRFNLKVGIMAEVEELLNDKVNTREKLEQYIATISNQFQKDQIDLTITCNPIDMQLDPKKSLAENNQQVKYAVFNMQQKVNELEQQKVEQITTALNKIVTEQVIPSSSPIILTDPRYLYSNDEIRELLNLAVDPEKIGINVNITTNKEHKNANLEAEISKKEALKYHISQATDEVLQGKKEKYLLPVHIYDGGKLADHWVALAITKDKNNKVTFYYVDSMGNPLSDKPILEEVIKNQIKNLDNVELCDLNVRQQGNSLSCGAWVVENLTKITNEQVGDITASSGQNVEQKLREKHFQMLDHKKKKQQLGNFREETNLSFAPTANTYRPSLTPSISSLPTVRVR